MKLFLTAVDRLSSSAGGDSTLTDRVLLFDPGAWSCAGASEMALANVSASSVARQVYQHVVPPQLPHAAVEGAVYFRYGPRPSPPLDSFLFHKRCLFTGHGSSGASPAAAAPPACSSASLVLPLSTSSSSLDMSAASPPIEQQRALAAGASDSAIEYDSLLALWLKKLLSGTDSSVIVTALLLFVEGVAIDMVTGSEVCTPFKADSGTARRLRTDQDAAAFLRACESTVYHSAAEVPRCPYHICIAVLVDPSHRDPGKASYTTFLDVASTAPESADASAQVRLREQTSIFAQLLGVKATNTTPLTSLLKRSPANQQWLGLLQSCELSRAHLVGLFNVACGASHDPFHHSDMEEDGVEPFALASALRQRALSEAASNGALPPEPPRPSHAQSRAAAPRVGPTTGNAIAPSLAPDSPPEAHFSGGQRQHSTRFPPLRRDTETPRGAAVMSAQVRRAERRHAAFGVVPHRGRSLDLLGRIEREQHRSRLVLSSAERRARELAEMRWILHARPPGKSIRTVMRWLAHNVTHASRPEEQQGQLLALPRHPPPPLNGALFAAAIRQLSTTATRQKPFTTPTHTPQLTFPSRAASADPFSARYNASPSFCAAAGSPSKNQGAQEAHFASSHAVVHRHTIAKLGRRCPSHSTPFSPAKDPPQGRKCTSARRFSAVEAALLTRVQSARPCDFPRDSPHKGRVERLYPLVRAFHIVVKEQDALMAEELMTRSHVEYRERNCRKALSGVHAEAVKRAFASWQSEAGAQQHQPRAPVTIRVRSAQPRPSRIFFQY
ncbi:hypothetical protein LSCM4_07831 [Leishmania orientalis]|uniref:Uncharacterized protein n=1 Tax=Leishmania orientalis TaxID=2249476 RepID=A0A836KUD3_9TRYP|nr:hypothetical protein LSCM4_07831 [Leishmania orientalis]